MWVYKLQNRTEAIQSSRVLNYFSVHIISLFTKFDKKTCLSLQKKIILERKKLFNKIMFFNFYFASKFKFHVFQ